VLVLIGLGVAVGVIVVLFLVTRLIRSVRPDDEFGLDQARRFPWRSRSMPSLVVPVPPIHHPSNANADLPASRSSPLERVAAYSPRKGSAQVSAASVPSRRSVSVKQSGQSKAENARRGNERPSVAEQQAHHERNLASGSSDYARLGEQVTAVLTTAEHAAAEIRESANRDAENIRREAEKQAAASKAEADALRADADAYGERTRTTADAYAEQKRRTADAQAAKAQAAFEERARAMQAEAERKAKEIETKALRRRDVVRQSATHLEERITDMLATFRGMTSDLEGLLPPARQREGGKPQDVEDVAVDDTLEDALKPERASSDSAARGSTPARPA
jgi:hypothetical protein